MLSYYPHHIGCFFFFFFGLSHNSRHQYKQCVCPRCLKSPGPRGQRRARPSAWSAPSRRILSQRIPSQRILALRMPTLDSTSSYIKDTGSLNGLACGPRPDKASNAPLYPSPTMVAPWLPIRRFSSHGRDKMDEENEMNGDYHPLRRTSIWSTLHRLHLHLQHRYLQHSLRRLGSQGINAISAFREASSLRCCTKRK